MNEVDVKTNMSVEVVPPSDPSWCFCKIAGLCIPVGKPTSSKKKRILKNAIST